MSIRNCYVVLWLCDHAFMCVSVFKYDTVHGVYEGTVENDEDHLIVDGKKIKVSNVMACDIIVYHIIKKIHG